MKCSECIMSEERHCAQISVESISTWGEAVGVSDIPKETCHLVAADVTYRLHQTLYLCRQFLHCSKRQKLTTDDFNRALKWSDVPSIFGHSGCEPVEWQDVPEVGVHVSPDPVVNLTRASLSRDVFHQPGSPYVRGHWAYISGHRWEKPDRGGDAVPVPLPLSHEQCQYYQALFTTVGGTSDDLFQMMCDDLATSPNVSGLVGAIVGGVVRGVPKSIQKPVVLKRLLLVIKALLCNANVHLGPQNYIHEIVNILSDCIITERKLPSDTQAIRSLACSILLKVLTERSSEWEFGVSNLTEVLFANRPWSQHVGALTALMYLGPEALYKGLAPNTATYSGKLFQLLSDSPHLVTKDLLDGRSAASLILAGLVKIVASLVRSLPVYLEVRPKTSLQYGGTMDRLIKTYSLGQELFSSAFVLQVPRPYLCVKKEHMAHFLRPSIYRSQEKEPGEAILDSLMRPPPKRKCYSLQSFDCSSRPHRILPGQVFESYRPCQQRLLRLSVKGCPQLPPDQLKQRKFSMPLVKPHPYRRFLCIRKVARMPHVIFTVSSLSHGYSIDNLII